MPRNSTYSYSLLLVNKATIDAMNSRIVEDVQKGRCPRINQHNAGRTPPPTCSQPPTAVHVDRADVGVRHTGAQRGAASTCDVMKDRNEATGSFAVDDERSSLQRPCDFESASKRNPRESGYGAYGVPVVSKALSELRLDHVRRERVNRASETPTGDRNRSPVGSFESDKPETDEATKFGARMKSVVVPVGSRLQAKVSYEPSSERHLSRHPDNVHHRPVKSRTSYATDMKSDSETEVDGHSDVESTSNRRARRSCTRSPSTDCIDRHSNRRPEHKRRRSDRYRLVVSSRSNSLSSCDRSSLALKRSTKAERGRSPSRRERKHKEALRVDYNDEGRSKSSHHHKVDGGRYTVNQYDAYSQRERRHTNDRSSSPSLSHSRERRKYSGNRRRRHTRQGRRSSKSDSSPEKARGRRSKSEVRHQKMKPGRFDGSQSLETFLAQFNTCADYNSWTDKDRTAFLKCSLSGGAAQLLWDTGNPEAINYAQLVERLKARYGSAGQAEKFRVDLQTRRRRGGESLTELHADIRRLMALAYPDAHGNSICETIARDHFLSALGDKQLELKLREREPPDLDSAFRLAVRLEAYSSSYSKQIPERSSSPRQRRERDRYDDRLARRVSHIEEELNQRRTARPGADSTDWRRKYDELVKEYEKLKLLEDQRKSTSVNVPGNSKVDRETPMRLALNERRCFGCGETGHFRRSCPAERFAASTNNGNKIKNEDSGKSEDTTHIRGATTTNDAANDAFIRLRIQGVPTDCLLDTGAEVSLIPYNLCDGVHIQHHKQSLRAANGTVIPIVGRVKLLGYAHGQYLDIDGLVTRHVPNVILGLGWLKQCNAVWNFKTGSVELNGQVHELHKSGPNGWCRRVVTQGTVVVPPLSEAILPASVIYNDLNHGYQGNDDVWTTDTNEPRPGLRISRVILPDRAYDVPIRVLNVTKSPIHIEADEVLSEVRPAVVCSGPSDTAAEVDDSEGAVLKGLVDRVDETVPPEYRSALYELLVEFRRSFSFSETDIGRTTVLRHAIHTGDAQPVRQALRRHPPAHQAAITEHIATMLQQGVIERAQSPWASNIVLVKKKDDSLRCCIDYRGLNNVTRKDAYPLPRTDTCLDAMNGAKWFTTFDLRSSYHQVELEPQDADKTAFICREGSYRFVTMPFGLCNAGATFQRLMDVVMCGLNFDICLVYLDDIICYSSTLEEHLQRLRLILQRLQNAGLKLKPSKCNIMQKTVEFLGHLVSADGIKPHPEKIIAVVNWPIPSSLRDLRAFLGLCGYYRRFIFQFSAVAAPLYSLTEKGRSFEWTSECQSAFEQLKQHLTSSPILCMPTDHDHFVLDTDASDTAIGAVLSQSIDGVERVVAYASKRLSRAEMNYCVTRRELLAVVFFVKYFRHYLLGRRFTVRSDHAALQWLRRIPEPMGQQARWIGLLEEFDFDVIHRPGNRHGNADAMSRRPCSRQRCCRKEDLTPNTDAEQYPRRVRAVTEASEEFRVDERPIWDSASLSKDQLQDPDIGPIYNLFASGECRPNWDSVAHMSEHSKTLWRQWSRLVMESGVLKRRFEPNNAIDRVILQPILPRNRRQEFLTLIHEGITGGHLGRKRTEANVQRRAYWPSWSTDTRRILQRCTPCAQYRRGNPEKRTPLKPLPAGEPWETISIDLTGPHPRSSRGYVYILTLQDHFSKWAEAVPLRNHTAPVVASALFSQVLVKFGMPLRILSDQGAEFESQLFRELCQLMGIAKIRTTPYRPATNGMVERLHRTMNSMIAKVVDLDQRNWCQVLPGVMAAYRATVHESTGFSPNMMLFGHENRMPVDIVMGCPGDRKLEGEFVDDYINDLQERLRSGYQVAREHLGIAAERRKIRYDAGMKTTDYSVGDWVWYFYPRRRVGRSPKWQKFYDGPFLITKVIDSHTLVIQRNKKSRTLVVHKDKLKRCLGELPNSWLEPTYVPRSAAATSQSPEGEENQQQVDRLHPVQKRGNEQMPNALVPTESTTDRPQRLESPNRVKRRQRRPVSATRAQYGPTQDGGLSKSRPNRNRQRPRRFDSYVLRVVRVSGVNMPKNEDAVELTCRACSKSFRKRRYLQRHLRDSSMRKVHEQFFADRGNEGKLMEETRLDWSKISSQAKIDRTTEYASRRVGQIRCQGQPVVPSSRRFFHGITGRRQLEQLVSTLIGDSACSNVQEAMSLVLKLRPDLTEDEAEIIVVSAFAGAQLVAKTIDGWFLPKKSATGGDEELKDSDHSRWRRWRNGLPDGTIVSSTELGGELPSSSSGEQLADPDADPTTQVEPDSPPPTDQRPCIAVQSEATQDEITIATCARFQPLVGLSWPLDDVEMAVPSPLWDTLADAAIQLRDDDDTLESFVYPVNE